jgi:cytochrome c553
VILVSLLLGRAAFAQITVGDIRIDPGDFSSDREPAARIAKCLGCHGKHLAGDIDFGPDVHFGTPALWGMQEAYIEESLLAYKTGQRSHEEMTAIAAMLDAETVDFMSRTFAAFPTPPAKSADELDALTKVDERFRAGQIVAREGVPAKGVPACASCHGAQGEGNPVLGPRLAGQNSMYIQQQFEVFADGTRRTPRAAIMQPVVDGLDEEQLGAVAFYYQQLVHLE